MSTARVVSGWVGRRSVAIHIASAAIFLTCVAVSARAADVLFPSPLHITREISDPISGTTSLIDEYCYGSRVVAVSGSRTAIADYAKGELTSIDFERGTYSITKFEAIAAARGRNASMTSRRDASEGSEWNVESRGSAVVASRPGRVTEATRSVNTVRQVVRVTADSQLMVSRDAMEAILGTAYPNETKDSTHAILDALRVAKAPRVGTDSAASRSADPYHLPLEQVVRYEMGGETIETRNVVKRIGAELPPADVLTIPPGARLVESELIAGTRLLDELDRLPSSANRP